jgi:hypothetical protein
MERDLETLHRRFLEHKPYQAQIARIPPQVQFRLVREIRLKYRRVHRIVGQRQLSPFRFKKSLHKIDSSQLANARL